MKRTAVLLLTGALLFSSMGVFASGDRIEVLLNGAGIEFDTAPEIVNDRTFVPLRAIAEKLGASLVWDGEAQSITITRDGAVNHMRIGDRTVSIEIDGNVTGGMLDAAPYIKDSRTMVPLRYIAEGFDMQVDWNGADRVINITDARHGTLSEPEYYSGFSYAPDFGRYFNTVPSEGSGEGVYFYEGVTDKQRSEYDGLLISCGFVKTDEISNDAVTSRGYETADERIVTAEFDNVFGVTVMKKQGAFTGAATYYDTHRQVPDYGAVNGLKAQDIQTNSDGTTVYTYKSASSSDRTGQILKYLEVLKNEGYTLTAKTLTALTMTNEKTKNYVTIDIGTEDTTVLKITAK